VLHSHIWTAYCSWVQLCSSKKKLACH